MSSDQDRQNTLEKLDREASWQVGASKDQVDWFIANVETVVKAAGWTVVGGEYFADQAVKRVTFEIPAVIRRLNA